MKNKKETKIEKNRNVKGLAWYKYPWVWFMIALPASAVIAGLITVYIAHQNAPQVIAKEHRFHVNQD